MNVVTVDHAWFAKHPGIAFRLRPATALELARLRIPAKRGWRVWAVIRCWDEARSFIVLDDGEQPTSGDHLAELFGDPQHVHPAAAREASR